MLKINKIDKYANITIPPNWNGRTIEDLLKKELHVPKKMLHHWRMNKSLYYKEETLPWSVKVMPGDTLSIPIYEEEDNSVPPFDLPLSILYEDDDILVINKPTGLNTHPANQEDMHTLTNAVSHYFLINGIKTKPRHIHRLDKDTSGAILFAKHAYAGAILDEALADGQIKRTYAALVCGMVQKDAGTVNAPIGRDRHTAGRMRVSPNGKPAVTHYKVVKRMKQANRTLVSCRLETGRTHQIRVHMSHIKHPLVSDVLYGGIKDSHIKGQALHAYKLDFLQPLTKERLQVECPLPWS
ncbi:RluA family pseudouridine synthase [Pradoshia sp.]